MQWDIHVGHLRMFVFCCHSNKDEVTLNNLMKAKLVIFSHPREKFTSAEVVNYIHMCIQCDKHS